MLGSVVHDPTARYPESGESFSPSEAYPEYPFSHIASRPNPAYRSVRRCLSQCGLDAEHYGTPRWNPLGRYVNKGDKVFLLCNFVFHKRPRESWSAFHGKCTHGSILRAIADYVLIAAGPGGEIVFGNAPLQSCDWRRVLADTGAAEVEEFYRRHQAPVRAKDLRLWIAPRGALGRAKSRVETDPAAGVSVSLDEKSLLDAFYQDRPDPRLRVSDYDPDLTAGYHGRHRHRYVLHKDLLAADVVLHIPKMKTHEKVGITIGLKGLVGGVARKDCLAHHRFGPPELNGDEYPDDGRWQPRLSAFHDFVYRRQYPGLLAAFLEILDGTGRRIARRIFGKIQAGGWHGNDTAWRMAADLTRIMYYADQNGIMTDRRQRTHLALIDGIVGGEGDGPLAPRGAGSRTVVFSDDLVLGDLVACRLMGYDPEKIPLLRFLISEPRLFDRPGALAGDIILNERRIRYRDLGPVLARPFAPPKGWRGILP